jgi:hypothetical protein
MHVGNLLLFLTIVYNVLDFKLNFNCIDMLQYVCVFTCNADILYAAIFAVKVKCFYAERG